METNTQETAEQMAKNYAVYNEQVHFAIKNAVLFGADWQKKQDESKLASVCEALEQIKKGVIDNLGKDADGKEIDFKTIAGACAEIAEQALNNIK